MVRNSRAPSSALGLTDPVISMRAVVEVAHPGTEPPWLALTADCTKEQVGLFVTALAETFQVAAPGEPDRVVDALLAEEMHIVPGGLLLVDTDTGAVVTPGCCAGLEDWRDWARVLAGESPWLGHDPEPSVEATGDDLRVRQDRGSETHILVPRSALPGLLTDVRRDLLGFLGALDAWTTRAGLGERGKALVAAVDRDFTITPPLEMPGR